MSKSILQAELDHAILEYRENSTEFNRMRLEAAQSAYYRYFMVEQLAETRGLSIDQLADVSALLGLTNS